MSFQTPEINALGLDSIVVRFSATLDDAANRAAIAFASAVRVADINGIAEVACALTSVYLRFDPLEADFDLLMGRVSNLATQNDWYASSLPSGRRLWRIPVAVGGADGPQLDEAADIAGATPTDLKNMIADTQVRVLALGFAPGQPYMGVLPKEWDIPRQSGLTPTVPAGALVFAVRQMIIFSGPAPTGWRHIGLSGFRPFRPNVEDSIALAPGDEVSFRIVDVDQLDGDGDGLGGATVEAVT